MNLSKRTKRLLRYVYFILRAKLRKPNPGKKMFPSVIQLPITKRCNSRCVMCDIWQMDKEEELSSKEFGEILKDSIFKEVKAVGVNGGEPTLLPNLNEYIDHILTLPKIKSLNIISNGFKTDYLLGILEDIKGKCVSMGVQFHVSISLDGVGEIHDKQRGISDVFQKTTKTIDALVRDTNKYCHSFDVACTVTKINVDYLVQLERYAQAKGYPMKFRLGIENKRIGSDVISERFSVLDDSSSRQSAKEFFFHLFYSSQKPWDKYKYFCIFKFLQEYPNGKRLLPCAWKEDGITLDSQGNIYYCAVASDRIGSLKESNGEAIYFAEHNLNHRRSIVKNSCSKCIHDYHGTPHFSSIFVFLRFLFAERFSKW